MTQIHHRPHPLPTNHCTDGSMNPKTSTTFGTRWAIDPSNAHYIPSLAPSIVYLMWVCEATIVTVGIISVNLPRILLLLPILQIYTVVAAISPSTTIIKPSYILNIIKWSHSHPTTKHSTMMDYYNATCIKFHTNIQI